MGRALVDRGGGDRWVSKGRGWEGGRGGAVGGAGSGQHARLKAMDVEEAETADEGGQKGE